MASPDKVAAVAELKEMFTSSSGAVLTEYRGLSVKALKELRRSLGDDATYAVSKNTLTQIAAREAGVDGVEEHLVGPTAIAFIDGDPVNVAKGLRDFARAHPFLVIKGGVLDGKSLTAEDVRKLADLESREVLLAKVAGGMQGVLQQAISLDQRAALAGGPSAGGPADRGRGEPVADRRRRRRADPEPTSPEPTSDRSPPARNRIRPNPPARTRPLSNSPPTATTRTQHPLPNQPEAATAAEDQPEAAAPPRTTPQRLLQKTTRKDRHHGEAQH